MGSIVCLELCVGRELVTSARGGREVYLGFVEIIGKIIYSLFSKYWVLFGCKVLCRLFFACRVSLVIKWL